MLLYLETYFLLFNALTCLTKVLLFILPNFHFVVHLICRTLWHYNRHFNCDHQGPKTDFYGDFETPLIYVQHTKTIVLINNLIDLFLICIFLILVCHIFLVIHSLNLSWQIMSLGVDDCRLQVRCLLQCAMCQFTNFVHLEKVYLLDLPISHYTYELNCLPNKWTMWRSLSDIMRSYITFSMWVGGLRVHPIIGPVVGWVMR